MQSWGESGRYNERFTELVPTKSGIIGLLAAAEGRRRTDPIEDLVKLRFAVRVDQPGTVLRDYQTAEQAKVKTHLSTRYYLSDAVFVAAVESEDRSVLEGLKDAINQPAFPLYLGRRSCPAPINLVLGIVDTDAVTALKETDWQASSFHRKQRAAEVNLPIYRDAKRGEDGIAHRDVPVSFSQESREYAWRKVVIDDEGAHFKNPAGTNIDPFFEAVISS